MNQPALMSAALRVQAEQIADSFIPPERPGRPNTLTDADKMQHFLACLSDGNYRDTAAKLSGLSTSTLHRILKDAEAGKEAAMLFREAVEKAEAFAEAETVRNVRQASKLPQFWAAGMTYLERKYPDRWGRRDESAVSAKVQVSIGGPGASDVQVGVQIALSPAAQKDLAGFSTVQVDQLGPISRDYVNQNEPVPEPAILIPAQGLSGVPGREGVPHPAAEVAQPKARRGARKEKKHDQ